LGIADSLELALLQGAQQLDLQMGRVAPVNAPRTCPKSSLSSKLSLNAPQLTRTNGRLRRWLNSWIA
jgi:hypothetical protein